MSWQHAAQQLPNQQQQQQQSASSSKIKGSDLFVKILTQYGVKQIFGIPGEGNPDFMISLQTEGTIDFILTRHEQGAAFNAYGLSQAQIFSGGNVVPGVCLSTQGPGATNLVAGLACATHDKVPVIAITGQLAQTHKRAFQNVDVVGIMEDATKWSISISDPNDISEIICMAFRKALTPPYGAVHIELPSDVANQYVTINDKPLPVGLTWQFPKPNPNALRAAYQILTSQEYKKPIFLVGPGVFVRTQGEYLAWEEITKFVKESNIPVVLSLGGKGAIDPNDPRYLHTVDFPPYDWPTYALLWADIVIAVGYDQAECPPSLWNLRPVPILHIDGSPAVVGWNYQPLLEVVGDIGLAFKSFNKYLLNDLSAARRTIPAMCALVKEQWQKTLAYTPAEIQPDCVFQGTITKIIGGYMQKENGLIVLDVGAHQLWMLRNAEVNKPGNIISSNNMSTMGISLPCALGYSLQSQIDGSAKKILVVAGDGGFLMTESEMSTIHQINKFYPNAKVVVVVWNDSTLGNVAWGVKRNFGKQLDLTEINPKFEQLGLAYDWTTFPEVTKAADLETTLSLAFAANNSALFSVRVDTSQNLKFSDYLYAEVSQAVEQDLSISLPAVGPPKNS